VLKSDVDELVVSSFLSFKLSSDFSAKQNSHKKFSDFVGGGFSGVEIIFLDCLSLLRVE